MEGEREDGHHQSEHGRWSPAEPPDDDLYVVYSIGDEERQQWPAELLDYSFQRVNQPGTLIRLVSGDNWSDGRKVPISAAGHTLVTPLFRPELRWPIANKVGSLQYLFEALSEGFKQRNRNATILFLDPDMIFTHSWDPSQLVSEGEIVGQRWIGYGKPYCLTSSVHGEWCPDDEESCFMYPFAVKLSDIETLAPEIAQQAVSGYQQCGDWMTDMTAFVIAAAMKGLNVSTIENLGLCSNWDNRDDKSAPLLHYCQPIRDPSGKEIWNKSSYTAWQPLPDPSLATNRVDREVLKLLNQLRQIKKTLEELFSRPSNS